MWIFAVAHVLHFGEVEVDLCRVLAACAVGLNCSQVIADRAVIRGSVRESFFRQIETRGAGNRAAISVHFGQNGAVVF